MGGACDDMKLLDPKHTWSEGRREAFEARIETVKHLLAFLGADPQTFRYACPTPDDLKSGKAQYLKWNKDLKPADHYMTDAWHQSLLQRMQFPFDDQNNNNNENNDNDDKNKKLQIAVHVRRGDVTPCGKDHAYIRYLPNSYYLKVLHDTLPRYCGEGEGADFRDKCQVIIHSESQAYESFQEFTDHGYQLELDRALEDVWKSFMEADVLVVSDSAFSFVPATLNRHGDVLYPPMDDGDYAPLPGWIMLDESYVTTAKLEQIEMHQQCQNNNR
mmetsp:Transcript_19237/g.38956  ORF Transcript_19237/g.38956 Transcript_19237/m.38956 type:complete len:273 (+) Transcript_19237:282-1100(+)